MLFDGADGEQLLADDRLDARRAGIDPLRRTGPTVPAAAGGTIHLCVVDDDGMGVSLIQSNAAGWGAIWSCPAPGSSCRTAASGSPCNPATPPNSPPVGGRRTPSPPRWSPTGETLVAVLGTQGGDIQPQVVLQLLARMLRNGQIARPRDPGTALDPG